MTDMTDMGEIANTDMAALWDGPDGDDWARDWDRFDRSMALQHACLMSAAAVQPNERVLDIGCGNGQVARAAAAQGGSVLGVDLSSSMLDKARALAGTEGLTNIEFLQADAQVHPFAEGSFDLAVSRFGVMFFADRAAAFANIARALRPGGRLVMLAWQGIGGNPWIQAVLGALAMGREFPPPPPGAPGPLGLSDERTVVEILTSAGFQQAQAEPFAAPMYFGDDTDDAFSWLSSGGMVRGLTQDLSEDDTATALSNLRAALATREAPDGVRFDTSAWLFTATR